MGFLEWATSPWGRLVPIHIAWFLIWVAVISGFLFFVVHAAYLRYFANPREFAGVISPAVAVRIPEHVPRHSLTARLFHWIMAASMFTLLFTAFLPKVGVQFPWVTYHWIAGVVLTASILFHIIHASFFMDFWAIWPDRIDLRDAWRRMGRFAGKPEPPPDRVRQISFGEQALPRCHHRRRSLCDHNRRVPDVSCAHRLLSPQSISLQRHDLGHDVCAARSGGCRTDRIDHGPCLLRTASGETPHHEVDDLRLDEPRLLFERA